MCRQVKLTVADTGTGIPPDKLEKIFEPLFTTKEAGVGSGLGLTTVKGIVDESHGRIDVTSKEGEGTCFSLYFPAMDEEDPPPSGPIRPVPTTGRSLQDAPPESATVLVVDDQAAVRTSISGLLRKHGYLVLSAGSAKEGLQLVRDHPKTIHLVITDVEMPSMNGQEMANRIRAVEPQLKVLFLSGHTRNSLLRKSFLEGREHFLRKPFEVPRFLSLVDELIAPSSDEPSELTDS